MRGSYAFLTVAVICFAIFAVSWFAPETAELASYEPSRGLERSVQQPTAETWLTLGNISGICGIVSLMIQVWQWRRA
jgi:hypothetical protein